MKTITIGFSTSKHKFLSKIIRKIEKTQYSHVYIKFYSESIDRTLIYHASGLKVNFLGKDLFEQKNNVIKEFEIKVSNESYKNCLKFAVDRCGQPYSIKQLFSILFYKLTKNTNFIEDSRKAYVCSELVAELLQDLLGKNFNKNLDIITPKDIYKMLEENSNGKT